ncbi:MAG: hypothetical protein NMK33_02810 [Candidatus Cardinium sp.]|uniref:hypothetical protein n=1 Tax=Cardinium endosymbiont of Dermatophagoides farinae TaxID=2597823 RepID=UPI001182EC75|nr:hypothetical protein [Cardinium endosymbiont of Dermatophagoides farinae]TSJ81405.1 hypothetical protein FPG78_05495 [Cardinium endosymbiont of Dermatophagoides farinae]UWW97467.1 MAG: hypothetical protein NMK33_02810 [Candidatus Cardinium sp.]
MKQLHIMLLFTLTGCSEVYKMGINGGNLDEISIGQAVDTAPQPDVNHVGQTFTISSGRSISFVQKGRTWVATVYENLSPFIGKSEALSVYFEEGFSVPILSNYQPERQKNLIHIMPTTDGKHIVYVGRLGLQGGGLTYSQSTSTTKITTDSERYTCVTRRGISKREKKQSYKCFHCRDSFSSYNEKEFNERLSMHRCHKEQCEKCLVTNQCPCDIGKQQKYCM